MKTGFVKLRKNVWMTAMVKVENAIFAMAFVAQINPNTEKAMVTAQLSPCHL